MLYFQADNEHLEAKLSATSSQLVKLQQQLSSLSQMQEGLQASLQGKQSAEASLMAELTQVRSAAAGSVQLLHDSTSISCIQVVYHPDLA